VLHGAFYVPALRNSILSLGRLDEGGSEVRIKGGILRMWDQRRRLLIKVQRSPNHLYIHHFNAAVPSSRPQASTRSNGDVLCLTARKDEQAWLWHELYDHLHFDVLHKLCKEDMVHGMPVIKHDGFLPRSSQVPHAEAARAHARRLVWASELICCIFSGSESLIIFHKRENMFLPFSSICH